jgi:phosphomevalonate kinase
VNALAERDPARYRTTLDAQATAAHRALLACQLDDAEAFIAAIDAQRVALSDLGRAADANIVTAEVAALAKHAARLGATVIPAGAGGGDIALFVGREPSSLLDGALLEQHHERLALTLGVEGVHRVR